MGFLWWLAQEFWPVILGAIGLLAAWLGVKGFGASKAAQATQQQEIKGAQTRREVEEDLARTSADERRRRMLEWKR